MPSKHTTPGGGASHHRKALYCWSGVPGKLWNPGSNWYLGKLNLDGERDIDGSYKLDVAFSPRKIPNDHRVSKYALVDPVSCYNDFYIKQLDKKG